jgi:hypothetical protein
MALGQTSQAATWLRLVRAAGLLLTMPPVTAYLALNFTGSTPFTSRTGVRREMTAYIRHMAWTSGLGIVLTLVAGVASLLMREG